jgi:hypothetical protein
MTIDGGIDSGTAVGSNSAHIVEYENANKGKDLQDVLMVLRKCAGAHHISIVATFPWVDVHDAHNSSSTGFYDYTPCLIEFVAASSVSEILFVAFTNTYAKIYS